MFSFKYQVLKSAFLLGFVALGPGSPWTSLASADELRPFETDGCTRWRDGTRADPTKWRRCCVIHDLRFWAGGLAPGRDAADRELRDCVAATGARLEAETIYFGVRIGSLSPWKLRGMQWGNAWSKSETRTTPLSRSEIDLLESEMRDPRYDDLLDEETRLDVILSLRGTD